MWNLIAPALLTLAGTYIASDANARAAQKARAAQVQGAQITADAIRQGSEDAQATLRDLRTESAPAVSYLRRVVAEPGDLTPAQQVQLDDLRRNVTNTIHSSPFAGSGRAAAALFRRAESDFTNTALDNNRARADNAARTMYGASTGAATGIATNQASTGTAIGKVTGEALTKGGLYDAQADIANGTLTGRALGDIGSLIATEGRESRYADRLSKIEKSLGIR